MPVENEPTRKQLNILGFIGQYLQDHSRPPSRREIEQGVGFKSLGAVTYQINQLEIKGLVTRAEHVARGLDLTDEGKTLLGWLGRTAQEAIGSLRMPIEGVIAAGEPVEFDADFATFDEEDAIAVDTSLLPQQTQGLHALRVRGNSMIDALVQDRDIVILREVHDARTEVRVNDMVAAWLQLEQEMTLKYYFPEGDMIRLQPANPDYDPIITHASNVAVQGKVILVHRQMV